MQNFRKNLIHAQCSIRDALEKINTISDEYVKEPLALFVINDEEQLVGTLTDGDIRRGLIAGKKISDNIRDIMNSNFHFLQEGTFELGDFEQLRAKNIKLVPVLDKKNEVVKIYDLSEKKSLLPVDAMIMAGGKGTRLRPLTNDTPKPLLKVGSKPIIEHNLDHIGQYGIDNIVITVNYLAHKLSNYFQNGASGDFKIRFVHEEKPLGTIGSLSLVDQFFHDHILLMNSDLLTTIDLYAFYKDFVNKNADMAVATIPYEVKVPYAVLDLNGDGIQSFKEKPEYTYYSNAGIYLIKKELIERIPKNEYMDATDFMENLINDGKKVTYFPILDYWLDIGRHEDYEKAQKDIRILDL